MDEGLVDERSVDGGLVGGGGSVGERLIEGKVVDGG